MTRRIEIVAGSSDDGSRLDAALAAHPAIGSRASAQRLIEAGRVTVGGRPEPKRHRLFAGERIVAQLDDPAPMEDRHDPGAHVRAEIVHEDVDLMVLDKPAGVVVHPAPGHPTGTLAQAFAGQARGGADAQRAGIVHRLDRDTSGLIVVARSEPAYRGLRRLVRAHQMRREYVALVEGRPDAHSGTIDAPIGRDALRRTLVSTRTDAPRQALTHFQQVEPLARTTLLRVRLETGRTHQIRVHLAAIGHPVCGDRQYGGWASGSRLGLRRQFLHSAALTFHHPMSGKELHCESELPSELAEALEAARQERR